jgi:hypothetical protein
MVVGDILTCKLRVDYKNLKKGEQSGYVHSKHYPYLRRDTWYLIITDETFTGLAAVEKLNVEEDFFEKEYQERITRPGPINFTAILCNDCYKGLDQFEKNSVNIVATSTIRTEYKYKKADIRGIKDNAIFFKRNPDIDSDDSDQEIAQGNQVEDDFTELVRKLKKNGLNKASDQVLTLCYAFSQKIDIERPLPTPFIPSSGQIMFESVMRQK